MGDDRWILGLETATPTPFIMLSCNGHLKAHLWMTQGAAVSNDLFDNIQKILNEAHITLNDLSFIATGLGPGSYTGMRVGYVVAEMLAYSLKKPFLGYSSLSVWFPSKPGRFATCLDAKMGRVYVQEGVKEGESIEWDEPNLTTVQELNKKADTFSSLMTCPGGQLQDIKAPWIEEKPNLDYVSQMLDKLSWKTSKLSLNQRPKLYYLQQPYIHGVPSL